MWSAPPTTVSSGVCQVCSEGSTLEFVASAGPDVGNLGQAIEQWAGGGRSQTKEGTS